MALTEARYTFIDKGTPAAKRMTSERIAEFKGYNARGVREDGEMKDMMNLSSDDYPMLSQRKQRAPLNDGNYIDATQIISKSHVDEDGIHDALTVISKDAQGIYRCYYDGQLIEGLVLSEQTSVVAINDKLCFFPEKKWWSIHSNVVGDISASTGMVNRTIAIKNDEDNNRISSVLEFEGNPLGLKEKFKVGDAVTIKCETASSGKILITRTKEAGTIYGTMAFNTEYEAAMAGAYNEVGGADTNFDGDVYYGLHDRNSSFVDFIPMPYDPKAYGFEYQYKVYVQTFSGWQELPYWGVSADYVSIASEGKTQRGIQIRASKYAGFEYITRYKIEWSAPIRYIWVAVSGDYQNVISDVYMSTQTFENDESALAWAKDNLPYTIADMEEKKSEWSVLISQNSTNIEVDTSRSEPKYLIEYGQFNSSTPLVAVDKLYIPFDSSEIYTDGKSRMSMGINNTTAIIQDVSDTSITFPDNTLMDSEGKPLTGRSELVNIEVSRPSPDLDYVAEWNNRLWGCSNKDNTIYACKLGDPTNWYWYQTTSLDSYAAEQGSNGRWTGIGKYSTHLMFFKEDCIHKVYGNYPAEFQIVTQVCSGCEEGSSKSIVTMEDGVVYKSRRGIMGYSGGIPTLISMELGNNKYRNAVAGTDGRKYYVSMLDKNGDPHMFAWDSELQIWHKEDDLRPTDFECYDGKLCYIGVDDYINYIDADEGSDPIEWMAEFGPFDEYVEEHKIYSLVKIRYKKDPEATMQVDVSVDEGEWETKELVTAENEDSGYVEFIPRRCDRFSIKLSGTGRCDIKGLTREFRQGSLAKENY